MENLISPYFTLMKIDIRGGIIVKKKFMSVLLAVSLLASVLTGCSEKNVKEDKEIEDVQEDDAEDKIEDDSNDNKVIEAEQDTFEPESEQPVEEEKEDTPADVEPSVDITDINKAGVAVNVVSKYLTSSIVDGEEYVEYDDYASFVCEYDVENRNIKIYNYDSNGVLYLAREAFYSDRWDMNKLVIYENGNVSRISEFDYKYNGDILLMESETYYDESGQITWMETDEYEYNNQGDLLREISTTYNGEKTYIQITEHVYDAYGNLLSVTGYDENGDISGMSQEYEYNTGGDLIKEISYYNDRRICGVTIYEYYETGKLNKEIYCDYDHNSQEIDYVLEEEYDLSGNLIKYIKYDSEGNIETNLYEYYTLGNEIKEISYNGECLEEIFVTEYDKNGNLLYATFYDELNNVVAQNEYVYDVEGNIMEHVYTSESIIMGEKCTYDSKGNRVQLIEYDGQGDMKKYEAEYITIIAPNEKAAEALLEITNETELNEPLDYVMY